MMLVLVLVGICAVSSSADLYLKYKKTTDAYKVAGSSVPVEELESVAWIGKKNAFYSDGDGNSSIVTFANETMVLVDTKNSCYTKINLDSAQALFDDAMNEAGGDGENAVAMKAMMQGMMGSMMKNSVTIEKTGEKKKIGTWNCTGYTVTMQVAMSDTKSNIWVTDEIKIDPVYFNMVKNGVMAKLPGFESVAKELEKLKGIPVETVTTSQVMGTTIKTIEVLVESGEKSPPSGIYAIPEGFKNCSE